MRIHHDVYNWQWKGYARAHRDRVNLLVHLVTVPLFWLGVLLAVSAIAFERNVATHCSNGWAAVCAKISDGSASAVAVAIALCKTRRRFGFESRIVIMPNPIGSDFVRNPAGAVRLADRGAP